MTRFERTILQVVPRLDSGGAERSSLEIASAVCRAGGRAIVVSKGGRLAQEIKNAGGEVIEAPVHSKNPVDIYANGRLLAQLIVREKVDLIHARSRAPAWSAFMAARRENTPFVTTYHGAYKRTGPVKRFYNSSMLRADRVIANSHYTASQIEEAAPEVLGKVRVIPRGVDIDLFDRKRVTVDRVNQLTKSWGLGENLGLKLLLPARLTRWKGHEAAISAVATVKERLGKEPGTGQEGGLTLVFCGGAQGRRGYEQRLRAMIDECGVRSMVHIVGDCADMPAAYAWADAVLAPSVEPEAFGRTAVEAGAMRKPVIASDHGGARETVIDGETGWLVKPDNVQALAESLEALLQMSVAGRRTMGEVARARVASVYSSAAMCDSTLGVYRELLTEQV